MIENDVNGLLVQNDVASLSAGMLRMIQEPEFREPLGEAGQQIVERFNWDAMVDAYEGLLASVVEHKE